MKGMKGMKKTIILAVIAGLLNGVASAKENTFVNAGEAAFGFNGESPKTFVDGADSTGGKVSRGAEIGGIYLGSIALVAGAGKLLMWVADDREIMIGGDPKTNLFTDGFSTYNKKYKYFEDAYDSETLYELDDGIDKHQLLDIEDLNNHFIKGNLLFENYASNCRVAACLSYHASIGSKLTTEELHNYRTNIRIANSDTYSYWDPGLIKELYPNKEFKTRNINELFKDDGTYVIYTPEHIETVILHQSEVDFYTWTSKFPEGLGDWGKEMMVNHSTLDNYMEYLKKIYPNTTKFKILYNEKFLTEKDRAKMALDRKLNEEKSQLLVEEQNKASSGEELENPMSNSENALLTNEQISKTVNNDASAEIKENLNDSDNYTDKAELGDDDDRGLEYEIKDFKPME